MEVKPSAAGLQALVRRGEGFLRSVERDHLLCAVGDDGGDEVAQQGCLAGSRRTVHADDAAISRLLSRQIDRRLLQQDQRMASSARPSHGRVEMRGDGAAERGSAVQEVSLLGRRDHSQVLP
ncbi:hypothetical protein D3C85_1354800 [compost metagenome]